MVQGFSREPGTEGPLADIPEGGRRRVWRWAVVIALGGFLFGFDTGVVSGALLYIKRDFGLSAFEQGSVVSVLLIGAMLGAVAAGRMAENLGRRKALGIEGAVFLIGTAILVAAPGYGALLVGRVVLGLAVGAASATVPVYLSEVSPKEIRGRVLTLNQLMITTGILISYFVNLLFASGGQWRGMFAVGALPALGIVVGALWVLPESPQWLIRHGRRDEARALIVSVAGEERADHLIEQAQRRETQGLRSDSPRAGGWRVLLEPRVRAALIVGLTLAAVQQFGGINTIIYYAPTTIENTGLSASNSILYSVAIGVINLLMTIVAIKLVDRAGRRRLLLGSLASMLVMLALLGLSFVIGMNALLSLLFMVVYIAAFAVGLGPVFWVLIGEIFPPHARAAGSSASTAVNWISNFVVSLVFLPVANVIGQGQTFWVFAAVCAFGLWFVSRYVPETRGRDFEQVDAALQTRFRKRPQVGAEAG
ncbi:MULTISPECIES: sugar porter family MFS transporter [unclassified Streptomyces]|uniref:sugar porter family MFS transporter n=1 Tax=unclassified Streptomyces TaxID=2593676 RepID=UPI002482B996|nr:sugar porter family MFS transporter [Streptomyces sp. ATE26]MDI1458775.1 sugar porter family MFS transporter [Streptomyces sp. ATE26]